MRPGRVLVILVATLPWLACVGWPLVAAVASTARSSGAPPDGMLPMGDLVQRTGAHALAVALLSMLAGWRPGRWLADRPTGRAALLVAPLVVPSYVVYYAWWQVWPADGRVYAWALAHDAVGALRSATLVIALVAWSWPIVALLVALARRRGATAVGELLRVDGAPAEVRLLHALREDGRGLAMGGAAVFTVAFANTSAFDLAQVFSVGNELRAAAALGATPAALLRVGAAPAAGLALAAIAAWALLARARPWRDERPGPARGRGTVALLLVVGLVLPLAVLAVGRGGVRAIPPFVQLHGGSTLASLGLAVATGTAAALVAASLAALWLGGSRRAATAAHGLAAGWLIAAVVPATLAAAAFEAAYNRDGPLVALAGGRIEWDLSLAAMAYRTPVILVLALLARFGVVPALLARWVAVREPAPRRDLRRLDGARGLVDAWRATGPAMTSLAAATAAIVGALVVGEVAMTARLSPPGIDLLGGRLLAALHYQRPEPVVAAVVLLGAAALLGGLLVALRPGGRRVVVAGVLMLTLAGCGGADGPPPVRVDYAFGRPGLALGQFSYPRAIAADDALGAVFVVDKTARIQRFALDGRPVLEWRMPEWETGKPTGVSVSPRGTVFVADTHYHRVIEFDAEGRELRRFGEYGEGPGQFIFPTDVAVGPDGRIYVTEYGGNDRIQVFDAEARHLAEFGGFGAELGRYSRPQSIVVSPRGDELFIADACNHRIVVTDLDGAPKRTLGRLGRGPGELEYPYGLAWLPDGSLLVAEFGNDRVQRIDPEDGAWIGWWGGVGVGEGRLRWPWGVATAGGTTFVLDSGNGRVLAARIG